MTLSQEHLGFVCRINRMCFDVNACAAQALRLVKSHLKTAFLPSLYIKQC